MNFARCFKIKIITDIQIGVWSNEGDRLIKIDWNLILNIFLLLVSSKYIQSIWVAI